METSLDDASINAPLSPELNAKTFALGSDFPADIDIPNIDGMQSTAFVVTTSSPAGVVAVDLDAAPLKLSSAFASFEVPAGSGIPNALLIIAADEAFLLTSTSVIAFHPQTGLIKSATNILEPIDIGSGHLNSNGTPSPTTIAPAFPGGIAFAERRLYVATANYARTATPAVAQPGVVLVFDVEGNGHLRRRGSLVTSCYNPTGLAVRGRSELIVTNSGIIDIVAGKGKPASESCIDIVDLENTSLIATISLGTTAASFHPIALVPDGSMGFVGSASFGELYQIDLLNRRLLRGHDNPLDLGKADDFITDVASSLSGSTLFAASFERSAVLVIDLTTTAPVLLGKPYVVGFPAGVTAENPTGANTGAGPLAIRPGTRGKDYAGPDLFVLTSYPGRLIGIDTGRPAEAQPSLTDEQNATTPPPTSPPPPPPAGNSGDACQGFAQAVKNFYPGPGGGFRQNDLPNIVLGPPHGSTNPSAPSDDLDVVSLGERGEIILDLGTCHAVDKPGVDFLVFENPFFINNDPESPYAELGSVSVSLDGLSFTDFPCQATAHPYTGCAGWHPVISHPGNGISPFDVAAAGGDPFDLADVGLTGIRYIRIIDINGSGVSSAVGFDLDAVSIINGVIR